MSIRMRSAAIAVAATGALGLGVLGAGSALAGTGMVTVVTHTMNHPDTYSQLGLPGTCNALPGFGGGPVWAYDNLSLRLVATPAGPTNTYNVTIYAHGSFDAVCDPTTGGSMTGHGSVDGSYQLTVVSVNGPVGAVPAQQPSGMTGQGAIVGQLFPDATSIIGGHYSYTYNPVDGMKYHQSG